MSSILLSDQCVFFYISNIMVGIFLLDMITDDVRYKAGCTRINARQKCFNVICVFMVISHMNNVLS